MEAKMEKPVSDAEVKVEKPVPDGDVKMEKPVPDGDVKMEKPIPIVEVKMAKPLPGVDVKMEKPVPDVKVKVAQPLPDVEVKMEKPFPGMEVEMEKPKQVLVIEPENELLFKGPYDVVCTAYMKLSNPSDKKVMYKMRTTSPKQFCVNPNAGVLDPKETKEIAVSMNPFVFNPAAKNHHKFMVQSVFLYPPNDSAVNMELWKEIPQGELMESFKVKCAFEMPVVAKASDEEANSARSNSEFNFELQKAIEEVEELREQDRWLKKRNLQLNEEIGRLREYLDSVNVEYDKYAPPTPKEVRLFTFFALGIIVALLGVVVGKFVL